MKRILFLVFVVLFAVGIASAQYTQGVGLGGVDILGAHQNGGRGCAGCHAPHSGGVGGGGNAATSTWTGEATNDPLSGSVALFGQDVTPLLGYTINFGSDNTSTGTGGAYVEILPAEANAYGTQKAELEGIAMCLACHDGVVAKGQMMNGQSWEQRMKLLPASVYGTHPIPTLLGNDSGNGNTSGYTNDHPVGVQATLGAVGVVTSTAATSPLLVTVGTNGISSIVPNSTAYKQFNQNYGYPAIAGSIWDYGVSIPSGDTTPTDAFITCTTCHNQHAMYVYQGPAAYAGATTAKMASSQIGIGTYPTYFFVNGPYNPGTATTNATTANSTTQFCRQCHFDTANEYYGINGVTTQF